MKTNHYMLLVRRYFGENWKRHALFTLFLVFLFYISFSFAGLIEPTIAEDFSGVVPMLSAVSILVVAIAYHSAHSMPFLATRTGRIAQAVIPSTPCSKYCAALTAGTLIPLVQTIIAALLADLFRFFRCGAWSLGKVFHSLFWTELGTTVNDIPGTGTAVAAVIVALIAELLITNAWYTFSATLFRRHPFLIGFIIAAFISQVLSIICAPFISRIGMLQVESDTEMLHYFSSFLFIASAVALVFTLILHILAFYRSKTVEL